MKKSAPWRTVEQLGLATAPWVEWWNQRRLHGSLGNLPPAEFEAAYHRQLDGGAVA